MYTFIKRDEVLFVAYSDRPYSMLLALSLLQRVLEVSRDLIGAVTEESLMYV